MPLFQVAKCKIPSANTFDRSSVLCPVHQCATVTTTLIAPDCRDLSNQSRSYFDIERAYGGGRRAYGGGLYISNKYFLKKDNCIDQSKSFTFWSRLTHRRTQACILQSCPFQFFQETGAIVDSAPGQNDLRSALHRLIELVNLGPLFVGNSAHHEH